MVVVVVWWGCGVVEAAATSPTAALFVEFNSCSINASPWGPLGPFWPDWELPGLDTAEFVGGGFVGVGVGVFDVGLF